MIQVQNPKQILLWAPAWSTSLHIPCEKWHPRRHIRGIIYTVPSGYQHLLDGSFSYSSYLHIHRHGLQESHINSLFAKNSFPSIALISTKEHGLQQAPSTLVSPRPRSGDHISAPLTYPGQIMTRWYKEQGRNTTSRCCRSKQPCNQQD